MTPVSPFLRPTPQVTGSEWGTVGLHSLVSGQILRVEETATR